MRERPSCAVAPVALLSPAQLYYGCASELKLSDHKPVHAVFEVCAKTTIEDRRAAVSTDITRQLDSMENRTLPRVHVSQEAIQVGRRGAL